MNRTKKVEEAVPKLANTNNCTIWSIVLIIFVTLKLTDQLSWSWFWILFPIWIPVIWTGIILFVYALGCAIVLAFSELKGDRD